MNYNEYKGRQYTIVEFIGLYIRYLIFKLLGNSKSIEYLSGEEDYPKINTRQRFYCLIVGLFFIFLLMIILLIFAIYPSEFAVQ